MPLLKSGKFPTFTENDLKLVLDRYLLTKVGAFPDCYERLAANFFDTKNEISALVTCERAVSIFYGWGHPVNFHAKLMSKIPGTVNMNILIVNSYMPCCCLYNALAVSCERFSTASRFKFYVLHLLLLRQK